jgi:hypothetical protein
MGGKKPLPSQYSEALTLPVFLLQPHDDVITWPVLKLCQLFLIRVGDIISSTKYFEWDLETNSNTWRRNRREWLRRISGGMGRMLVV